MRSITKGAQRSAAIIRIYSCGKVTLSAKLLSTLVLSKACPYVMIKEDADTGRLYIARGTVADGYLIKRRTGSHIGQTCSAELAQALARYLDGYGSYRVLESDYMFLEGRVYYRIDNNNITKK